MNCRKCGNAIGAGLKFCTKCGTPVEAAAAPPSALSEPAAAPPTPGCSKCGAPLKPGLRFCTACGARVEVAPDPEARPDDRTAEVTVPTPPPAKSLHEKPTAEMVARSVDAPPKSVETPSGIKIVEESPVKSVDAVPVATTVARNVEAPPESVEIPTEIKRVKDGPRCVECGAAMIPSARFCLACGTRVGQSKAATPPPPAQGVSEIPKSSKADRPAEAVRPVEAAKPVKPSRPTAEAKPSLAPAPAPSADVPHAPKSKPPIGAVKANEAPAKEADAPAADEQPTEESAAAESATGERSAGSEGSREKRTPAPEKYEAFDDGPVEPLAGGAPQEKAPTAAVPVPEPAPSAAESPLGVCARCGAQLRPGLRFCTGCGSAVTAPAEGSVAAVSAVAPEAAAPADDDVALDEEPAETSPITGLRQQETTAAASPEPGPAPAPAAFDPGVCATCGTQVSAGVRFCIGCGAPVEWWKTGESAAATSAAHASDLPPLDSAPASIQRKGISAGVLVAIFLLLLVVLAGCAFWLLRSFQYSPSMDVTVTEIPADIEDSAAEPAASDAADSGLTAEDLGRPIGTDGSAVDTAPEQDNPTAEPSSASGAAGGTRAGGSTPTSSSGSTSAGSASPATRKSPSTPTATKKTVQTARSTAPAPRSPVPFVDDPAPSSAAQTTAAPSSGGTPSPPPAAAVTQPAPTPVQPAEPAAPAEGIIYWTGKLQRNKRFIISTKGTDYGFADGKLLPGTPVEIRVLSPAVRVVEAPGPNNSWQRVILECTRNTNQSVTVNVQWFAAR